MLDLEAIKELNNSVFNKVDDSDIAKVKITLGLLRAMSSFDRYIGKKNADKLGNFDTLLDLMDTMCHLRVLYIWADAPITFSISSEDDNLSNVLLPPIINTMDIIQNKIVDVLNDKDVFSYVLEYDDYAEAILDILIHTLDAQIFNEKPLSNLLKVVKDK